MGLTLHNVCGAPFAEPGSAQIPVRRTKTLPRVTRPEFTFAPSLEILILLL